MQAGAIGRGGEALVLDMGEPVRHRGRGAAVAAQARPTGEGPRSRFTGLRAGEKLHEVHARRRRGAASPPGARASGAP